jgi:hypothetical protein
MIADLLHILMMHQGRDRAISAERLLDALRTYGNSINGMPELRGLVHDARQDGHLIASCQEGYYLPVDLTDALQYVERQFRIPARDELRTARLQRRRAIELFGQQLRMM